jgi:hypothetical protein
VTAGKTPQRLGELQDRLIAHEWLQPMGADHRGGHRQVAAPCGAWLAIQGSPHGRARSIARPGLENSIPIHHLFTDFVGPPDMVFQLGLSNFAAHPAAGTPIHAIESLSSEFDSSGYHGAMRIQQTINRQRSKQAAAAVGFTAAALMVGIAIASGSDDGGRQNVVAGSGEGSPGGIYTQPAVGGMTVGATETWQSPASFAPTQRAVPAVKAHG